MDTDNTKVTTQTRRPVSAVVVYDSEQQKKADMGWFSVSAILAAPGTIGNALVSTSKAALRQFTSPPKNPTNNIQHVASGSLHVNDQDVEDDFVNVSLAPENTQTNANPPPNPTQASPYSHASS